VGWLSAHGFGLSGTQHDEKKNGGGRGGAVSVLNPAHGGGGRVGGVVPCGRRELRGVSRSNWRAWPVRTGEVGGCPVGPATVTGGGV
jgi:hypothetical protein